MFAAQSDGGDSTRVKICGITNQSDAWAAIECGADALGFNFFRGSKRYIDPDLAAAWISELPEDVPRIAVIVNPAPEEAMRLARTGLFAGLQLHGEETPEFCRSLATAGVRFAKALPAGAGIPRADPTAYDTDLVILDSASEEGFGGTGRVFPWEIGREFVATYPRVRMILAGGLTPENVARAIEVVRPFGVDVTSSIESVPGRKDRGRMRAFVEAVRAAG